ncbi:32206_t:CDS:1, partial [Racocetra persica]
QDDHSEYPNWNLLSMQLLNTAYYYMKEYKRPIVLIFDRVDRIAKKDPEFLEILQDFAKDSLVVIFIARLGSAIYEMWGCYNYFATYG